MFLVCDKFENEYIVCMRRLYVTLRFDDSIENDTNVVTLSLSKGFQLTVRRTVKGLLRGALRQAQGDSNPAWRHTFHRPFPKKIKDLLSERFRNYPSKAWQDRSNPS